MELSLSDIRELLGTAPPQSVSSNLVGKKVLVRTVTFYYTGQVTSDDGRFLTLKDAAWIVNTGRFSTALTTGTLTEVEPFPDEVMVLVGSIVDVCEWKHDLPRSVK